MTKAEPAAGRESVRHSGFVILSTFVIVQFMNDLRFAFRQLLKTPCFTVEAAQTLAPRSVQLHALSSHN
jgi:hypothetical protein